MTNSDSAQELPQINIGDPFYHFFKHRLGLRLVHLLLIIVLLNTVRTVIIPLIHHNNHGHSLLKNPGAKDIQSWISSFIVQPLIIYVYWQSIEIIPRIYQSLHGNGVIKASTESLVEFFRQVEADATSTFIKRLMAVVVSFYVIHHLFNIWPNYYQHNPPIGAYPYDFFQRIVLETPHAFLLFSLTGWAAWRMLQYSSSMQKLWDTFELKVRVNDSDGVGGLRNVGNFTLLTGLYVGALILFVIASAVPEFQLQSPLAEIRRQIIVVGSVTIALLAPLAFFVPIWATHKAMLAARDRHLDFVEQQFSSLWHNIHSGEMEITEENVKELSTLNQLLEIDKKVIPVWPFKFPTVLGYIVRVITPFALSQLPSWLDLIAKTQPTP